MKRNPPVIYTWLNVHVERSLVYPIGEPTSHRLAKQPPIGRTQHKDWEEDSRGNGQGHTERRTYKLNERGIRVRDSVLGLTTIGIRIQTQGGGAEKRLKIYHLENRKT
eukprot:sb/3477600/